MTSFEIATLALSITVPMAGVVFGAMRWALRQEFARREVQSMAGDALLAQKQTSLQHRVERAHTRLDSMEERVDTLAQEMSRDLIRREDYVPAMALLNQKIDALSQGLARLEGHIK